MHKSIRNRLRSRWYYQKRGSKGHVRKNIDERWASFDQMRMIKTKVINLDAKNKIAATQDKT